MGASRSCIAILRTGESLGLRNLRISLGHKRLDYREQDWDLVDRRVPHPVQGYPVVAVDQDVTHTGDPPPRHLRVLLAKRRRKTLDRLAKDLEEARHRQLRADIVDELHAVEPVDKSDQETCVVDQIKQDRVIPGL